MNKQILVLFTIIAFGCATGAVYRPIVDPASITDQAKFTTDSSECERITNEVDYSNEENVAAIKGAAVGAGSVGVGAAVIAGAGGIVLAPIAIPVAILGALIGGGANKRKTEANEQKMRAVVWNSCLRERGYTVLSDESALR